MYSVLQNNARQVQLMIDGLLNEQDLTLTAKYSWTLFFLAANEANTLRRASGTIQTLTLRFVPQRAPSI
jgi:hypothetical protein